MLSDWLQLRKGFVNDTLRPPPFPPLRQLSEEVSTALACESRALTELSGGWSLAPLPAAIEAADARNKATLEQHAAQQEIAVAQAKERHLAEIQMTKKQHAELAAKTVKENAEAVESEEEALAAATTGAAAPGGETALAAVGGLGEDQNDSATKGKDEMAPTEGENGGGFESLDLVDFRRPAPLPLPAPELPSNGMLLFPDVAVEAASVVNQLLKALDAQVTSTCVCSYILEM